MEIIKRVRCLECGGLIELDEHHLAQKRHLECGIKKNKEQNRDYYNQYVKKTVR